MLYKTILLELLPSYPNLYDRLKREGLSLTALDLWSRQLRDLYRQTQADLLAVEPTRPHSLMESQARELALAEFQQRLSSTDPDALVAELKASAQP